MIRTASRALIIKNNRILLVKYEDDKGYWYVLPGGGQKKGETLKQCLRRECYEELGLELNIGQLRFVREFISKNHTNSNYNNDYHQLECIFICSIINSLEDGMGYRPDPSQKGWAWVELSALNLLRLYPSELAEIIYSHRMDTSPVYLGDVN
jgi:8-oxo-dGTP diphosphatase